MERRNVEVSVRKFVMSLAGVIYNVLLIFVVAGILGVGTSSIVAMVGSAGLAIGLALQGSLANLAGGVFDLTSQAVSGWRLYYYATIGGNRTEY